MILKVFLPAIVVVCSAAAYFVLADAGGPSPIVVQGNSHCTPIPDKAPKAGATTRCGRLTAKHKRKKFLDNKAPLIDVVASGSLPFIDVASTAKDPDADQLEYTYAVTGGRLNGSGANVTWDLRDQRVGQYTLTAEVDDGCGCTAYASTTFTVR
jgi:hypothetical protein